MIVLWPRPKAPSVFQCFSPCNIEKLREPGDKAIHVVETAEAIDHRFFFLTDLYLTIVLYRFANPGDLIDKVEGTLLDYDTDFQLLKQA